MYFKFIYTYSLTYSFTLTLIEVHFGMELTNINVEETLVGGTKRQATFRDTATGQDVTIDFGTFLTTPANKKRQMYEGNDIADEHVTKTLLITHKIGTSPR